MKGYITQQLNLLNIKKSVVTRVLLNKEKFVEFLSETIRLNDLTSIKNKINILKDILANFEKDQGSLLNIDGNDDTVSFRRDILISELDKIIKAQTLERARYYLKRLEKSVQKVKTSKINDINLLRWQEYEDIITDSLWILSKRDTSGAHLGWYWGNFVPQIPYQMMLRYTKKGDWVLDVFLGSGTTLIECRRLGRNGIGIDINEEVVEKNKQRLLKEKL